MFRLSTSLESRTTFRWLHPFDVNGFGGRSIDGLIGDMLLDMGMVPSTLHDECIFFKRVFRVLLERAAASGTIHTARDAVLFRLTARDLTARAHTAPGSGFSFVRS